MKLLTRESIIEALKVLAEQLVQSPIRHELVIVGGAALVLLYDSRSATKDVDVVIGDDTVRDAARRIASQLGLPDDWLNDAAKGYMHGVSLGDIILQTPSLIVHTLSLPQLLAMKLSAWRDDLDISDARLLLSKLSGGRGEVWNLIEPYLVPGRELKARYVFDDLWESEHGSS